MLLTKLESLGLFMLSISVLWMSVATDDVRLKTVSHTLPLVSRVKMYTTRWRVCKEEESVASCLSVAVGDR